MPLLDSPFSLCTAYTPKKRQTRPARVLHAPYTRLALTRHLLLALYLGTVGSPSPPLSPPPSPSRTRRWRARLWSGACRWLVAACVVAPPSTRVRDTALAQPSPGPGPGPDLGPDLGLCLALAFALGLGPILALTLSLSLAHTSAARGGGAERASGACKRSAQAARATGMVSSGGTASGASESCGAPSPTSALDHPPLHLPPLGPHPQSPPRSSSSLWSPPTNLAHP